MARAVGIDLGTTYTAVACVDEYGKPMVIKNTDGQTTTPSAVFVDPPNYVVGEVALQSTMTDPGRVVQFIKRFMGVPDYRVQVGDQNYSPEFVSSIILRKVVQEAEEALGERVTQAVITVPAYFTEAQRHATYEAGALAGLNVLRIINEPTAAALAYGISRRGRPRNILVYDLGGGTFDVTILAIDNDSLNVIA
ncbi:Hsp70 family protein, partial [bacterium]